MRLGLGNALGRQMVINPDGLSLDLAFAADKTLTARKGPTPTFTRASTATYYGQLIDVSEGNIGTLTALTTTTVTAGRASWFKSSGGVDVTVYYDGSRWVVDIVELGGGSNHQAALGSEFRPEQANWSGSGASVTTSSTFGIVRSAINEPRFDHDPVTLASKGLLIEESRTNALLHSSNFKNSTSSSYWENLSATTVTVDQIASPDGSVNADLLETSITSFDCFTRRTIGYTASTQYTYSIFLKQGPSSHRYVGLYIGAGITNLTFPFFDFNNPTVVQIPSGTMVGTINSTRVDAYPNGWYRVFITFTTAATPVTSNVGVYISSSNGILPSSSTAGLNAYIWGIQLELGAFPTSYIPTTTAALTRSADVCSVTTAGWSNAGNDTMLAEYFVSTATSGVVIVEGSPVVSWMSLSFSTSNRQRNIYRHGGTSTRFDATTDNNSVSLININKTALTSGEQLALNGSLSQTVASEIPQADISTSLSIGSRVSGATLFLNGHIARIKYFRKRLPNAKLQTLTT